MGLKSLWRSITMGANQECADNLHIQHDQINMAVCFWYLVKSPVYATVQINMAVLFWYLVKRDLYSLHVYSNVHVTFYKVL